MGWLRITLCTGILAATAFVPAAHAADEGGVSVTPATPGPGGKIVLRVNGCSGKTGVASSDVFAGEARLAGTGGFLVGEGRIRPSATPGTYGVTVTCGGTAIRGALTVVPASEAHAPDPASPLAPVAAGGGAPTHLAAGPGTAHAVTGLLLAGAAAAAVAFLPRAVGTRRHRDTT